MLYEIIGPACAKLALYLSKSYSNKLEDIVPAEEIPNAAKKSNVELLIERINKIQERIPPHTAANAEDEKAFTEAAEEQYQAHAQQLQQLPFVNKELFLRRRKK